MIELEFHEAANLFPLMEGAEFEALKEDIRKNGLKVSILLLDGKILDGRNRYLACMELEIEVRTKEVESDDPVADVISMNLHRRHLTAKQRRDVIAASLKLEPQKSNRQHAKQFKVNHRTVAAVRKDLESGGEILHLNTLCGNDGKQYPSKPKPKPIEATVADIPDESEPPAQNPRLRTNEDYVGDDEVNEDDDPEEVVHPPIEPWNPKMDAYRPPRGSGMNTDQGKCLANARDLIAQIRKQLARLYKKEPFPELFVKLFREEMATLEQFLQEE